ncbi:hypothetical protein V6N13_093324 [Hibiscus sabdariffa]|uniref:Uncharacterized protein n=2 Tax=Hibiscus sabdariffa TaxID=183260 RepID=A0ABR2BMS0_9ROSI
MKGVAIGTDSVSPALDIGESSKPVVTIVSDKHVIVDVFVSEEQAVSDAVVIVQDDVTDVGDMQAVVGSFEDVVVNDVSDRLMGDAEGDLQGVVAEVVVAPKVPSGVEFPSLQDSVQHKRGQDRPVKPKKTNIDDRKVLMEKIQGEKVSCLLRQILGR